MVKKRLKKLLEINTNFCCYNKKVRPGAKQIFSMEPNVKEFFNKPINLHVLTQKIHQFLHTIPKDEKFVEEYRKKDR